jgi:GTP cyclohydrolase II
MVTSGSEGGTGSESMLSEILSTLKKMQVDHANLATSVESLQSRVDTQNALSQLRNQSRGSLRDSPSLDPLNLPKPANGLSSSPPTDDFVQKPPPSPTARKGSTTSRIILTTYPGQSGINPVPLDWGNPNPAKRGPVVVSRHYNTIRRRNAIGAHGGSYSIYHALAVASSNLDLEHKPDFTNTEPATVIGPFDTWGDKKKIVAMDPFGHLAPWLYSDLIKSQDVDIRPTIAVTRAHMKIPELEQSVAAGRLKPDGKICINESGELNVTKFAVEPVWYLPGVAERFGIDEASLRRALFEHTGGSFPELITRNDIKVFLPPIGGLTVYCFGDPAKMSDPNVRLALRVHDECNGSDVFGSDICTCRPYLIFGIEEAVKEAQNGGSGVVIYFRKEGRALGEVTKYLVYNARKRGLDKASEYFKRTENIAGVKDMRFQALMPDILHWLGITKIDRMLSMSNMKHDAIVDQGIPIHERVPIPDEMIPEDSRVEIDAKM